MENQLNQMLPVEVAQIAVNVSDEKRNEVQQVLNHVFEGVSKMREQLESVVVLDEHDKINMKLANTIRLGVKQVRLDAEKTFDAKRAEVQSKMLNYKTEDQLWLKAKQTMQILTKEIEETAKWKEETAKRIEAEKKELVIQQRMSQLDKFGDFRRSDIENMSDESFAIFFMGVEKQHHELIETKRREEEERIAREKAEAEERERIRIENERLRAEAEAREKQLREERMKAETERKLLEEKARKEKEKQELLLKAEREEKQRLESELKAKIEAEQKAKKEKEQKEAAELKAKIDAERKLKSASDKTQLKQLAVALENYSFFEVKSEQTKIILDDVRGMLIKISAYIHEKSENI